jgi:ComEC/Rec2-related protein
MHTGCGLEWGALCPAACSLVILGIVVRRRSLWYICPFALLYLVGVAYANAHKLVGCDDLRWGRNMALVICPETVSEKVSENVVHGYARVMEAPERYGKIVGHRVYFIIKYGADIPARGQKLRILAKVEYVGRQKSKPFLKFLRKNHVFLYASNGRIEKYLNEKSRFSRICEKYRQKFFNALECGLSERNDVGIITGMLTGSKHMLSGAQKSDFCDTGTAHVFAISGFHIGVISLFFDYFLRLLKLSRRVRTLPVIGVLFVYLSIVGPTPSSLRAYTMLVFYYAAGIFGRRSNTFSSFVNSAAVNICCAPESVFSVSFLLSYGIVFGIVCIGANANKLLNVFRRNKMQFHSRSLPEKFGERICSGIVENFCIAFAASVTSIPMSVEFFGNFSYLTIILNVILVPLASMIIFFGAISLFFGIFNAFFLCTIANKLALVPISLINFTLHCSRKIGHGLVNAHCPFEGFWMLALVLVAAFGWYLAKVSGKITANGRDTAAH